MKKQMSEENLDFLGWHGAHQEECMRRLTKLTPPELRWFARKIIPDLAFDGRSTKIVSAFKSNVKAFKRYRAAVKNFRALKQAWYGIVRVQCEPTSGKSQEYFHCVATFKLA